ncbi:MAG: ABC-2 family transporter protein [Planctomycetota bacterium]
MSYVLKAIPALFKQSVAGMLQYRGEIILWAVWGIVYPAVAIAMWSSAAKNSITGLDIRGYGPDEFAAYFLLTMIVGHFCTAWDVYEMGYQIKSGNMSAKLMRPLLPVWGALTDNTAFKILTMVVLAPIWVMVAWLTQPKFDTTWSHLTLGLLAMVLASTLNFIWGYTLATVAFWNTRVDALGEVWFGLSLFVGGRLAPLEILPWPLQWAAKVLPFKWVIWFPSTALIGKLDTAEMVKGILIQLIWLVVGIVLFRYAWRAGVKRYAAFGV